MDDFFTYHTYELETMQSYIQIFAQRDTCSKPMASMDHLLRYWGKNKQDLYKLLGNNFDYHFKVDCGPSTDEIEEAIEAMMDTCGNALWSHMANKIYNIVNPDNSHMGYGATVPWRRLFNALFLKENLIHNSLEYMRDVSPRYELNGHVYQVTYGMKVVKFIGKLAKELDLYDEFETFRQIHAEIFNNKEIRNEVVLSIHPLDFLTMSESSSWSSCMNWRNEGDYRMGTVEMMNSPCVILAYIAHKVPLNLDRYNTDAQWNNKKWRELFIIDRDLLSEVKPYPSFNTRLSNRIIEELKKLAKENWGVIFEETFEYDPKSDENKFKDQNIDIKFETNVMYNDFYSVRPQIAFTKEMIADYHGADMHLIVNYSGETECMWCGCEATLESNLLGESHVVCSSCDTSYSTCCNCGSIICDDEICVTDDGTYCEDCFIDFFAWSEYEGEYIRREHMRSVYVPMQFKYNPDEQSNYDVCNDCTCVTESENYFTSFIDFGSFDDPTNVRKIFVEESNEYFMPLEVFMYKPEFAWGMLNRFRGSIFRNFSIMENEILSDYSTADAEAVHQMLTTLDECSN